MSDRTVIGGITYETIGSSNSNLLLKCNGTARIQWGSKLIDLVKNGKIFSETQQNLLYIIQNESEIKGDGIYIIDSEDVQIWVCKDNNKYNLTGTDLCISTNKNQNLTGEQKTQALINIGVQYHTLEELKKSKIQNGIAYITDTKTLYTIKDGMVEEFSAKLKTITVEQEHENGKLINSSIKIVLSILEEDYLILSDDKIVVSQPLIIKEKATISSEGNSQDRGYNLYLKNGTSYLDIDYINVRKGISSLYSGMIIMHSGTVPIPEGWAPCDGKEYYYNNSKIVTPNLINNFIVGEEGIELKNGMGQKYSVLLIMKL